MLYALAQTSFAALRSAKNRLLNRLDVPVVILIYHRVTRLPADPELLAVTPENFRRQLEFLRQHHPVVRLEDDWSQLKQPAVAITFDDGYADNALEALPILEELEVPATFFVSSGNLDTAREFWWDELARILLNQQPYPERFTLNDGRLPRTWPTADPAAREVFYRQLHPLMKQLNPSRREEWLEQLRHWAGTAANGRAAWRSLSSTELRRLAASPWATVGAHTVSHTALAALSEEEQKKEILESKATLERICNRPVTTFSYPFGGRKDYNPTSVQLCRAAGFVRAAANFPGQAHRWSDPFQLPRHLVRNWELPTFAKELKGFWSR